MRSLLLTLFLAVAALVLGALSLWQLREGSLDKLLGTPPVAPGERIYPDFLPEKVARITLSAGDTKAVFVKTGRGWEATAPWRDRMDPRAAVSIITFANTTSARDLIPRDKLDPALAGFSNGSTEVAMLDAAGNSLASFRLGRRTPLLGLSPGDKPQPIPTIYLLPLERGRKSHVYAATGDILPLLKDNFSFLRDHRPFSVNPLLLEKIRILTSQGELTLGRSSPSAPWRITKPLDLPTDPAAVTSLLEGLYRLQASKLGDRSEVTLPVDGTAPANSRIDITHFGESSETTLEILPPESPEARETLATVSDRPETVFTLPMKPEPDLISIPDLPLTVNDLRDPTLTNLNIASVRAIAIETVTTPTILISRQPPAPWAAAIAGKQQPANEQRLFDLFKAITETRALAFETDAAPEDLSPWGLDKPILTLTFLADNNQTLTVSFGLDKKGNLFAKRTGSPTVMRLDNSFLEKIAVRPNDWRHARLWSVSSVDVREITRSEPPAPPLLLTYEWQSEKWTATRDGNEATAALDPSRANFLLATLENLQVSRWLSPADEAATAALATPSLILGISQVTLDDFGDEIKGGGKTQTLTLAADPASNTFFGKISGDPSPFTISPEDYLKLSIPLMDQ
ncbi:DUF4340 domain-containing protein [Akkermansiaceae bacterium]|nr:DUF4340 domain-containing protein [Akkermansiaceae bacterium]